MATLMHAVVRDLPEPIQRALAEVGYGRKDIRVETAPTVRLSNAGAGNGYRAFTVLVNLTTGQHAISWGSWGGQNMFDRANPVDNDDRDYVLPIDGVVISGHKGGGQPVYASVWVSPDAGQKMLPSTESDLTDVEKVALACYKQLRSGPYRTDALRRNRVDTETLDWLVDNGYLSRNRAGATSITTKGKNALIGFQAYV